MKRRSLQESNPENILKLLIQGAMKRSISKLGYTLKFNSDTRYPSVKKKGKEQLFDPEKGIRDE